LSLSLNSPLPHPTPPQGLSATRSYTDLCPWPRLTNQRISLGNKHRSQDESTRILQGTFFGSHCKWGTFFPPNAISEWHVFGEWLMAILS
jgi:hypothetical protein